MTNATLFFRDSKFPVDFWRPPAPTGGTGLDVIVAAYPIAPGRNVNGVNTYTPDPSSADFSNFCKLYTDFVNKIRGRCTLPEPFITISTRTMPWFRTH